MEASEQMKVLQAEIKELGEELEALAKLFVTMEADSVAVYGDGYVTVPAYMIEQAHNILFPDNQVHDYTEEVEGGEAAKQG